MGPDEVTHLQDSPKGCVHRAGRQEVVCLSHWLYELISNELGSICSEITEFASGQFEGGERDALKTESGAASHTLCV